MSQGKNAGRNVEVQVYAADGTTPYEINGVLNANLNPGANKVVADTSDYGSVDENGNAYYEEMVTQRGMLITITGQYSRDDTTGAQDPGQARIEDLAAATGTAAYGVVRFRRNGSTGPWTKWTRATFELSAQDNPHVGVTSWGCVITRSGPATQVSP